MIVVTAVSTRVVGTAAKEIFVPTIIVGTIVPIRIVETAVLTSLSKRHTIGNLAF